MSTEDHISHERRSFVDNLRRDVDRVFVLGDIPEQGFVRHLQEVIRSRPLPKRELLRAVLSVIQKRLPEDLNLAMQEKAFSNAPIDVPLKDGYRVLEKVGSGGVNTVFFLNTGEGTSWAVGLRREAFKSAEDALEYAKGQEREYRQIKTLYCADPDLIPEEFRVIFENHRGDPNVMFFRKFIHGPMRDVFDEDSESLHEVLGRNPKFRDQMIKFVTATMENMDFVLDNQLDLLGKNNLAIVGEKGGERLVLLEPHLCEAERTDRADNRIKERTEFLVDVVSNYVHG